RAPFSNCVRGPDLAVIRPPPRRRPARGRKGKCMPFFDRLLVRPSHALLLDVLEEATRAASPPETLLDLGREHWHAVLAAIKPLPGGGRVGDRNRRASGYAGLVGLAWWTDPLGARHFRAWAGHSSDRGYERVLCPENDPRPPLWHVYPDRVFGRTRGGRREWLAACPCGVTGTPVSLGWR